MKDSLPRTTIKLGEARRILEGLERAKDTDEFRAHFNAFLSTAKAITNTLQAEGAHVDGFQDWYAPKQDEMRADQLLRYVHVTREASYHRGLPNVESAGTYVPFATTGTIKPAPDAVMELSAEGVFWILEQGTPRERRVPANQHAAWRTVVAIRDAPTSHRGGNVQPDPVTIFRQALAYYEELVFEGRQKVSPT